MKYSIIYSSRTGNTAKLAEAVRECIPAGELTFCGVPHENENFGLTADLIFAGFWTDKGTCCEETAGFLQRLKNKKVFLFGTAGFGGSQEYYNQILTRVRENLSPDNEVVGAYMCMGQMPDSVRKRYESMMEKDPVRMKDMIENFDRALTHPDAGDLNSLKKTVMNFLGEDNSKIL